MTFKLYSQEQLCYFARYVKETLNAGDSSLQSIHSLIEAWKRERPNEVADEQMSVEAQLDRDLLFFGTAYYTIENGKKTRIDPLKLNIISTP